MKMIIVAYLQDEVKINPENFGDYIREQRKKWCELIGTDKLSLLAV